MMQQGVEKHPVRQAVKKVQMQGGAVPAGRQEEARSEAYLDVRCNDKRPHPPSERGLRSRKLRGRFGRGACPPPRKAFAADGPFSTAWQGSRLLAVRAVLLPCLDEGC